MKELILTKQSQMGEIKIVLRIIKHKLYFKYNIHQYSQQAIAQYKAKGVKIREGNGWLEVDIFGDNKEANIGEFLINLEEDSDEKIENQLRDFYLANYIKSGFKLTE